MNRWHKKDELLTGLTYEDLINAMVCNCKEITYDAMRREFRSMLSISIEAAEHNINTNWPLVLAEASLQRKANENEQAVNG